MTVRASSRAVIAFSGSPTEWSDPRMYLHSFHIRNFRRLQDVHIDLENDVSIFVGANNSGKTSATHAIQLFMSGSKEFKLHDFSAECWRTFDKIGERGNGVKDPPPIPFPTISLDLWFHVEANDLHRVIDLLPSLNWTGSLVGLRIEFCPADEEELLSRYAEAKSKAVANIRAGADGKAEYHPWPNSLSDYLSKHLGKEFEFRYFVLDHAKFDGEFRQAADYTPPELISDKGRGGAQVIRDLIRIDFLNAQRHLTDESSGGRAEDLSKRLSRFYDRNLDDGDVDYDAQMALSIAENQFSTHLSKVFAPTLERLKALVLPGFENPRLQIKSSLNPASMMGSGGSARVHYVMDEPEKGKAAFSLPDKYNGLGFKNLIYMMVELLDFQARWLHLEEERPPLHLVFIEEPEAHLHAQLQQVFIRKVSDILQITGDDAAHYKSQLIITTHSPHILHERGFKPLRYFRRNSKPDRKQTSEVLNLSLFYKTKGAHPDDFLERYMKLTHCDLFFADAAILVEGNVERLLMPLMIEKTEPALRSRYMSVLEIGGAFGDRFLPLIEFLGITTLIITDLDSVLPTSATSESGDYDAEEDEGEENEGDGIGRGKACPVDQAGAVTSNSTLRRWFPTKCSIKDLLEATAAEKMKELNGVGFARVRVAYQLRSNVTWKDEVRPLAGRTLEESFALENLAWCQSPTRQQLNLRIPKNQSLQLEDLASRIYKRVKSPQFKKTDFALALLAAANDTGWNVPSYIAEGLMWLAEHMGVAAPTTESAPVEPSAASAKLEAVA